MYRLIFLIFFFSIVEASCPDGSLEWQTSCFLFKNNITGFATAEEDCIGSGGHLVSIHDAFTDALLAQEGGNRFHESTVTDFWIGLTNMMPGGNWSWMDGTALDFKDWASGEPKNISGNNCAALSILDGSWKSEDCFKAKPYICKVDKSVYEPTTPRITTTTTTTKYPIYAKCPFPFTYFQPTHSCYGAGNITSSLDWTKAENYCQSFGGHLSSIHSTEELSFLESLVYIAAANFWSGAFSNDNGKTWKWSDGTTWDYNPWARGFPNSHQSACGIIYGTGLGDMPCSNVLRPICKKDL